jgi:hypothetical protein
VVLAALGTVGAIVAVLVAGLALGIAVLSVMAVLGWTSGRRSQRATQSGEQTVRLSKRN